MLRILLDTNVLVNGIQDEFSQTNQIIELCLNGEVQPLVSRVILSEYQRLAKQKISDAEYLAHLDEYYKNAETIRTKSKFRIIVDDPEDNKFLNCAVDGNADYIITDDHHLLEVEKFKGVKIKSPKEFWNMYQEEGDGKTSRAWSDWMKMIGIGK